MKFPRFEGSFKQAAEVFRRHGERTKAVRTHDEYLARILSELLGRKPPV